MTLFGIRSRIWAQALAAMLCAALSCALYDNYTVPAVLAGLASMISAIRAARDAYVWHIAPKGRRRFGP